MQGVAARPETGPAFGWCCFAQVRQNSARTGGEAGRDLRSYAALKADTLNRSTGQQHAIASLQQIRVGVSNDGSAGLIRLMIAE